MTGPVAGPVRAGLQPVDGCALEAIARGWPVFPVGADKSPWIRAAHPPGHPCAGQCGRDGHGWRDATCDAGRWTGWIRRWPAIPAYGIATGPARLVVVDPDTGKGAAPVRVLPDQGEAEPTPGWVVDGMSVLAWAAHRDGVDVADLTDTFTVATPSGGRHLYYLAPDSLPGGGIVRNSVGYTAGRVSGLGWCIDVRAVGGYVVGPGSRIRTATRVWGTYRALPGSGAPQSLHPALQARLAAIGHHKPAQPPTGPADRPCISGVGGRAVGAPTAGGAGRVAAGGGVRPRFWDAAVAGELAHIAAAIPQDKTGNGRNATVNRAAYKLGQLLTPLRLPDTDVDAVAAQLRAAAEATGLPAREAAAAVASGLAQGHANPRPLTPPAGRPAPTGRGQPDRPRGRADPAPGHAPDPDPYRRIRSREGRP
jgi:hypothetical protein